MPDILLFYHQSRYLYVLRAMSKGAENQGFNTNIIRDYYDRDPSIDDKIFKCKYAIGIGWDRTVKYVTENYPKNLILSTRSIRSLPEDYWCISRNGIGIYCDYNYTELPSDRWDGFNLEIKPWRKDGKYILIAHQRHPDIVGNDREKYFFNLIRNIDREVIVCLHPMYADLDHPNNLEYVMKFVKLGYKIAIGIKDYIDEASHVITYNSSTAIDCILKGIPTYTVGKTMATPLLSKQNLKSFLNNPALPDRRKWCNWLAYQQWSLKEMEEGLMYKYYFEVMI